MHARAVAAASGTFASRLYTSSDSAVRARLSCYVGRKRALAALMHEIQQKSATGGIIQVLGRTGQGKSTFLAALIESAGPQTVVHHFIPNQPSPGHDQLIIEDIVGQLVLKAGLQLDQSTIQHPLQLGSRLPELLESARTAMPRVLIVVDGLDQLPSQCTDNFVANPVPAGVVYVLGSRPEAMAERISHRRQTFSFPLLDLDPDEIVELFERRCALTPNKAAPVFRSGHSALFLTWLADELAKTPRQSVSALLARVGSDPEGLFAIAIARLAADSEVWNREIRQVLGAITFSLAPLRTVQVSKITEIPLDRVRDIIVRLGSFVRRDDLCGHSLSHWELYRWLTSTPACEGRVFTVDDGVRIHRKIAEWCLSGRPHSIWDDRREREDLQYGREYGFEHLLHANDVDRIFEILDDTAWHQCALRFDPSGSALAQGIRRGFDAGVRIDSGTSQRLAWLPKLVRYKLLETGLLERGRRLPKDALHAMIHVGRVDEAIKYAWMAQGYCEPATSLMTLVPTLDECGHKHVCDDLLLKVWDHLVAELLPGADSPGMLSRVVREHVHSRRASKVISLLNSLPDNPAVMVLWDVAIMTAIGDGNVDVISAIECRLPEQIRQKNCMAILTATVRAAPKARCVEKINELINIHGQGIDYYTLERLFRAMNHLAPGDLREIIQQGFLGHMSDVKVVEVLTAVKVALQDTAPEAAREFGDEAVRALKNLPIRCTPELNVDALDVLLRYLLALDCMADLPQIIDRATDDHSKAWLLCQIVDASLANGDIEGATRLISLIGDHHAKRRAVVSVGITEGWAPDDPKWKAFGQSLSVPLYKLWRDAAARLSDVAVVRARSVREPRPRGWEAALQFGSMLRVLAFEGEGDDAVRENYARVLKKISDDMLAVGEFEQAEKIFRMMSDDNVAKLVERDDGGKWKAIAVAAIACGDWDRFNSLARERHVPDKVWMDAIKRLVEQDDIERVDYLIAQTEDSEQAMRAWALLARASAKSGHMLRARTYLKRLDDSLGWVHDRSAWQRGLSELVSILAETSDWRQALEIAQIMDGPNSRERVMQVAAARGRAGDFKAADSIFDEVEQWISNFDSTKKKSWALEQMYKSLRDGGREQRLIALAMGSGRETQPIYAASVIIEVVERMASTQRRRALELLDWLDDVSHWDLHDGDQSIPPIVLQCTRLFPPMVACGRVREALAMYTRAVEAAPGHWYFGESNSRAFAALLSSGDVDSAMRFAEQYLVDKEFWWLGLIERGSHFLEMGDLGAAATDFSLAFEVAEKEGKENGDGGHRSMHCAKGVAKQLISAGETTWALDVIDKRLRGRFSERDDLYKSLAYVSLRRDDLEKAWSVLNRAHEEDNSWWRGETAGIIASAIVEWYCAKGQTGRAVELALETIARAESPEHLAHLCRVLGPLVHQDGSLVGRLLQEIGRAFQLRA